MDVWFDSGTSWAGVANTREELQYPADVYLEGSDQHRGEAINIYIYKYTYTIYIYIYMYVCMYI
jgi:hypothetical protein